MKLTEEQKQNITNEYNQWKDKQYAGKTLEQRKELDAFFNPPEYNLFINISSACSNFLNSLFLKN